MRGCIGLLFFLTTLSFSQTQVPQQEMDPKIIHSLDLTAIDRSVDPCEDFYQFACHGWLAKNPIPADESAWGRFNELNDNNQITLFDVLKKASPNDPGRSAVDQKIGDFFASCMDEPALDKKGVTPLFPLLDKIKALHSKQDLPSYLAAVHLIGSNDFFLFTSAGDAKNALVNIASLDQGGLGLPDRDYYLQEDRQSIELRNQYLHYVEKIFELSGEAPAKASVKAQQAIAIETQLAKVSMDRVERRDPNKTYHKLTIKELQSLSPGFDWAAYINALQAPASESVDVVVPDFIKGLNVILQGRSIEEVKSYLSLRLISHFAGLLSSEFRDADFNFYGGTLTGAKEQKPRWKQCVQQVDADLGEAVGQAFVAKVFGPEDKLRVLDTVQRLEAALKQDIAGLPWMTETTKGQALIKLAAIENKIGYPDHWRDYSSVDIVRGDLLGDDIRATEFESHRQLNKSGHAVDKTEWEYTPATVDAYYEPTENNINFMAGILQPPFFDKQATDATNMGAIGSVIGHELTHGFDDQGRLYDAQGNLRDWWTPTDSKAFDERAQCLVDEYDKFVAVDDLHLKGKLTLGENTADNGGVRIALMALLSKLGSNSAPQNGFTPEQQFFLGYGQEWCTSFRPEASRLRIRTDVHSPAQFRVNGVLGNMPEFRKAWSCKSGQAMVRENACRVW